MDVALRTPLSLSLPLRILTDKGEEVEIPVSVEVKVRCCLAIWGCVQWVWSLQGVEGADGRLYVLDLFRLLPPDANYADREFVLLFVLLSVHPSNLLPSLVSLQLPKLQVRERRRLPMSLA